MKINREILRKYSGLVILLTGAAIIGVMNLPFHGEKEEIVESVTSVPVMSTIATFKLEGPEKQVDEAVRAGIAAMNRVTDLCNIFDPKSELSRLNTSAADAPFKCSPELWEILTLSRKFNRISHGAFDPTVRPLMTLWGFHRKRSQLPPRDEIREALERCGMEKVVFNESARTVFFERKGMSLDLGGIAKGWAVDLAAEAVREAGIHTGIIDLGGNMFCLEEPYKGRTAYRIAVKNPVRTEDTCAAVEIKNAAVATSGSYERFVVIDGVKYSHIMNPKTGHPAPGTTLSATVVTDKAVVSDALSTSLFLNGAGFMREIEREFPGTRCMFVSRAEDGSIRTDFSGEGWEKE